MTITHEMATLEALDLCETCALSSDVPANYPHKSVPFASCGDCGTCENVAEYGREMGPELYNGEPVLWGVVPLWAPEEDAAPASKPTVRPAAKRVPKAKPAPKRKPAANASGLTPKQVANRALAAALVSAGKDKTGTTWAAARDAVKAGKTIAQAVALA